MEIGYHDQTAVTEKDGERSRIGHAGSAPAVTILVVDDDPFVVEMLSELLSGNGYKILSANCGEEAVSRLRTVRVDVALVDLKMPGMDGLETIEKMAGIDPDTVTILMTGFPTIDSSIQAMRLGASDYVLKPFKIDEICLSVKRAIRERDVRLEMKNLRKRVSELEKSISNRKESIKVNQKLGVLTSLEGYSAKIIPSPKPHTDQSKTE